MNVKIGWPELWPSRPGWYALTAAGWLGPYVSRDQARRLLGFGRIVRHFSDTDIEDLDPIRTSKGAK